MSITQEGCREDYEQEQTDGISIMCSGLSVATVYFMEDFMVKTSMGPYESSSAGSCQ